MEKIIRRIVVLLAFIILPIGVLAEDGVSVNPTSLTIEVGETKTFTITAVNTSGSVNISSGNSAIAAVNKSSWDTGVVSTGQTKTEVVTVTGVSAGTTTITMTINATTLDDEDLTGQTKTVSVTVKKTSSNNNLSNIKINGNSIASFDPLVTTYNVETEESSAYIEAVKEDSKASVAGVGLKALNYGNNKIVITVTAEDGSTKKYTVNLTRRDTRDSNNTLLSLTIDKGTLNYDKTKTTYDVQVEGDVEYVTINAVAESAKAQITGIGLTKLKYGDNKIEIKVTAETGSVKTYIVNVNRKDTREANNNLVNLMVDKGTILFDKNTLSYSLDVNYNVDKVVISATTESDKATVSGIGEQTLKVGSNKFEVKVKAENESVKTYIITITRLEESDEPVVESLISSLSIVGVDFAFDPEVTEYNIPINDQKVLTFEYTLAEEAVVTIDGNDDLENGSKVTLRVDKGEESAEYIFNIIKVDKQKKKSAINLKGNWLWIVLGILAVLLIVGAIAKTIEKKKKEPKEEPEKKPDDIDSLLNSDANMGIGSYETPVDESTVSNEPAPDLSGNSTLGEPIEMTEQVPAEAPVETPSAAPTESAGNTTENAENVEEL